MDPVHVTIGDGDLEQDILPHYMLQLPCEADNLRYGDNEDFGPMGHLYVRFETTPTCLDRFLAANSLQRAEGGFAPGELLECGPSHHAESNRASNAAAEIVSARRACRERPEGREETDVSKHSETPDQSDL